MCALVTEREGGREREGGCSEAAVNTHPTLPVRVTERREGRGPFTSTQWILISTPPRCSRRGHKLGSGQCTVRFLATMPPPPHSAQCSCRALGLHYLDDTNVRCRPLILLTRRGTHRVPRVMVNKGRGAHHNRPTLGLTTGCVSDGCCSRVWQQWLCVLQAAGGNYSFSFKALLTEPLSGGLSGDTRYRSATLMRAHTQTTAADFT